MLCFAHSTNSTRPTAVFWDRSARARAAGAKNTHRASEMTHPSTVVLLVALWGFLCCCDAWVASSAVRAAARGGGRVGGGGLGRGGQVRLAAAKPDLFSDDLFDDDDKPPAAAAPDAAAKKDKGVGAGGKAYLDQKWKLNAEDAKDFKGFPSKKAAAAAGAGAADGAPLKVDKVPVFALMYKFRKEYVDVSVDSVLADHKGHSAKFKRLLNTELLTLNKQRGVVMLWAGFSDSDKEETRADIMRFMEDDPFIAKDVIESWDIISLDESQKKAEPALPGAN